MVTLIKGDIFAHTADYQFLVQQCNCLTTKAHGFSAQAVKQLGPYADIYGGRCNKKGCTNLACDADRAEPGTFRILYSRDAHRQQAPGVVCLFAQWSPGKIGSRMQRDIYPSHPGEGEEDDEVREKWFAQALDKLLQWCKEGEDQSKLWKFAFPHGIGCGLAGGDWDTYAKMIDDFARRAKKEANVETFIYKLV